MYIHFQLVNMDYKELAVALVAVTFSLLHLAQTFMGLWQLHLFKQCANSSIKSMESLGYETSLLDNEIFDPDKSDADDDDQDGRSDAESSDRIERIADNILVNESLIDNRVPAVDTVCEYRLFSREECRKMRTENSTFKRLCLRFWYGFANALRLTPMKISLTFRKCPRSISAHSVSRLVPRRPESTWVNWATALVA